MFFTPVHFLHFPVGEFSLWLHLPTMINFRIFFQTGSTLSILFLLFIGESVRHAAVLRLSLLRTFAQLWIFFRPGRSSFLHLTSFF
jgi:hypothetical protein